MYIKVRLAKARQTSWTSFRKEWIRLMCLTRNARSKKLSEKDAETIADKARRDFLDSRFALATRRVEEALKAQKGKAEKRQEGLTRAALARRAGERRECAMRQERLELFLHRRLST